MFSALKRMTSGGGGGGRSMEGQQGSLGNTTSTTTTTNTPPGLTAMSVSLQKRLVSKGVHYNMKIILKGDRNVGKTQLFRRLQAQPFIEEYTATEEIQVANIMWNYKTSDDIVKVEIWDVVDVANKKKRLVSDKLKIENNSSSSDPTDNNIVTEYGLDANTIDVYKNTNGVILVFDITKTWTFDYVKREIENVPDHIPVLILGNRRDMGHHRAVQTDTVIFFIENLEREGSGVVRYAESSMRNGFGLKFIHKFFNLPYLQLQRAALLKQLETSESETEICHQELDLYAESDEANYDFFIDGLAQKRRQIADALAPPKLSLAQAQALASEKALKETKQPEAAVAAAAKFAVNSDPSSSSSSAAAAANRQINQLLPQGVIKGPPPITTSPAGNSVLLPNKPSILKSLNTTTTTTTGHPNSSNGASPSSSSSSTVTPSRRTAGGARGNGIDDFVPDTEDHINAFLNDTADPSSGSGSRAISRHDDSSEDETHPRGNPLVVSVEEDFDEDDVVSATAAIRLAENAANDSSDDDEESEEIIVSPSPPPKKENNGANNNKGFNLFVVAAAADNNNSNKNSSSRNSLEESSDHQPSSLESGSGSGGKNKSSKKSSSSHHHHYNKKPSKHNKKSSNKKEHHHQMDLEEFLSGDPSEQTVNVDSSAYEAL